MAHITKRNDQLLAKVNFPLYCVEMLSSRHVIVAGGGGSSKTGVANGLEIYEIYHNGQNFVANEITRHETGPNVVMNMAITKSHNKSILVVGQESHSQMYSVKPLIKCKSDSNNSEESIYDKKSEIRRRRTSTSKVEDIPHRDGNKDRNSKAPKQISFELKNLDCVQTDFEMLEPWQRVVRISGDGKHMATGGTDSQVRIWRFPQMILLQTLKEHTKEIDDIDFSPDGKHIASVSKDGQCISWDVATGSKNFLLSWNTPNNVKYVYKRIKYGIIENNNCNIFTICNPLGRVGKLSGYLHCFDGKTGVLKKSIEIDNSLASLAVRDDGKFVAIGTMSEGNISIFTAFNLQRILHIPNAHSMFVTGICFIPVINQDGPCISSNTEVAAISISIDNKVCIHSLKYRSTIPIWLAIICIIVILFLSFIFCSYIGL